MPNQVADNFVLLITIYANLRYSNIFGCALERRTWHRGMGTTYQSPPRYYSQIFEAKGHSVQRTALYIS
jgi:hypothetical protein